MAAQTYSIDFKDYWREKNKSDLPSESGIYCVYSSTYLSDKEEVSIKKLIYIGESKDVKGRIADHERTSDWKKHLNSEEELFFSFGATPESSRVRCEAAMIFKHEPPENTEYVDSFPFDQTTINLSDASDVINFPTKSFTVNRT